MACSCSATNPNQSFDDLQQRRARLLDSLLALKPTSPAEPLPLLLKFQGNDLRTSKNHTPLDVFKSQGLDTSKLVVAKVNGKYHDLTQPLQVEDGSVLEAFSFSSPEGKHAFWHSSAHLLGYAVEKLYGGLLCVGPPVDDGFYYDFYVPEETVVTPHDFEKLEAFISDLVTKDAPFERFTVSKEEALELFQENKFKQEMIKKKVPDGGVCTVYRCGDFVDLCKGPHVPRTSLVKATKMMKASSSYWLGNSENDSLRRIYGVSFPDEEELRSHIHNLEEAAKRDHRLLGQQQELFMFHELSPGSCFFYPRGARLYNGLVSMIRKQYLKRDFQEVITPNIYNHKLWEISGHLANYRENMFSFEIEGQQFALKPMNCPGHCLMFASRSRSYKELPLRLADFGVLHRNELSGTLTGLTRVRRFQQDDAHIFCAPNQIQSEISSCLDFLKEVYGIFGMQFELALSTKPENHLGSQELWERAERELQSSLEAFGEPWQLNPGDGAFYGPKIDIRITDALQRKHQCATIQLDFNLPERFNLQFVNNDGNLERPVMIHRAMLGSVERMIAILIEHTGGKWPFWISPRQCLVIPISERQQAYAQRVAKTLQEKEFFVDLELSDKKLDKKIREAHLLQYNFILVVGRKEEELSLVSVRARDSHDGKQSQKTLDQLLQDFEHLRSSFK